MFSYTLQVPALEWQVCSTGVEHETNNGEVWLPTHTRKAQLDDAMRMMQTNGPQTHNMSFLLLHIMYVYILYVYIYIYIYIYIYTDMHTWCQQPTPTPNKLHVLSTCIKCSSTTRMHTFLLPPTTEGDPRNIHRHIGNVEACPYPPVPIPRDPAVDAKTGQG